MNPRLPRLLLAAVFCLSAAQVPAQNLIPRILPPPGIEIPAEDEQHLREQLAAITKRLEKYTFKDGRRPHHVADVEVFLKAVRFALENGEFFDLKDVGKARDLLKAATSRVDELDAGTRSWETAHGLVVRGMVSPIDDSVQPVGFVIPQKLDFSKPVPLYVWLHGRGDKMCDLQFIHERMNKPGQIQPENAIVVHPFGRYCNAFKFAGEMDVLDALVDGKRWIRDATQRWQRASGAVVSNVISVPVVLWGFSMGGAGAWHLGAHHPDWWDAVSPGAGFAETAKYQNIDASKVPSYERTLWGLYDSPDYVRNLFNVPVVAYSGELDKQMQAAMVMADAYRANGRELEHLIGPGVEHKYEPKTLAILGEKIAGLAARPRERDKNISLQTKTMKYRQFEWIAFEALERHWRDSRIDARVANNSRLELETTNVRRLNVISGYLPPDFLAAAARQTPTIVIDGTSIELPLMTLRTPVVTFEKSPDNEKRWQIAAKRPLREKGILLHGPIDDAFMRPFLVVTPSEKSPHAGVDEWVAAEVLHFQDRWKRLFRGELRMKRDVDVDEEEARDANLVLWGDRFSNKWIARLADKLPLNWDREAVTVGDKKYDSEQHVLSLIAPNPLQGERGGNYVVLNSGITFREGHDKSNSLQTPKLPDWAVIDLSQPPDAFSPGKVVNAGFFNEQWQYEPGW